MRVNKAIEDGSFFENPALVGGVRARRARAPAGSRLLRRRPLAHRPPARAARFAPEKTWIHAFTDGRDVSPTSAVHDLAELPHDRIATVVGPLLRDGPRPALGADRARPRRDLAGHGARGDRPHRGRAGELRRGGHRRVHRADRRSRAGRGSSPATRRSSSTSGPTEPGSCRSACSTRGFDLTTMTRYRDDLDCPVVFAEQEVAGDDRRGLRRARHPPAARRRDREVRARHVLLQRRPRGASGPARRGSSSPRPATCRATT